MNKIELTPTWVAYILFFWLWGLIGLGIFLYGMYRYGYLGDADQFRIVEIGVGVIVAGNVSAYLFGKFMNRNRTNK